MSLFCTFIFGNIVLRRIDLVKAEYKNFLSLLLSIAKLIILSFLINVVLDNENQYIKIIFSILIGFFIIFVSIRLAKQIKMIFQFKIDAIKAIRNARQILKNS